MSSFGETLRTAREAKGLSCSQVAAQTHMLVQIVEEMEREDFHRIPAPIYGRGFVRLFADCVGLDPVPLVREFMDIYEGRRTPAVSVREVPVAPVPPPVQPTWQTAPDPQPVSAEPVAPLPPEDPVIPPPPVEPIIPPPPVEPVVPPPPVEPVVPPPVEPVVPPPVEPVVPPPVEPVVPPPAPIPETPRDVQGLELFEQVPARTFSDDQPLFTSAPTPPQQSSTKSPAGLPPQIDFDSSRFLTSDFDDDKPSAAARFRKGLTDISNGILKKVRNIPRRVWRMTILVLCAVLGIIFIVWSIGKLYTATSSPDSTQSAETVQTPSAEQPDPAQAAPTPNAPKTAKAKPAQSPAKPAQSPAKPAKLIQTGPEIPNLIRD